MKRQKRWSPAESWVHASPAILSWGNTPSFWNPAKGAVSIDVDGNEFIDYLCGYGPIILGYREDEVDDAVFRQIKDKGFCFTLTQPYQNELAKKLNDLVPSAELSIFLKTGSDATTAAIRIARAYTGRVKVMRCGYHGWHDWCVEMKGGIPEKFYEDVHEFHYNDLDMLEDLMKKHGDQTAAIIMTPFGHPLHQKMQEPKPGFLEGVRKLADKYGSVLVFDEVRTCFRLRMGGAQELYGVTPDLTVLGKGMANGWAISVVTGKKDVMMAAASKLFISSTFFPNSDGYIAALKTIEIMEREKVLDNIWEKGERLMAKIQGVIEKYPDADAELTGVAPMWLITFKGNPETIKDRRTGFYTQLIRKGFFFTPHHHAYISFRHTEEDLNLTLAAIDESMAYVSEKLKG